MSAWEKITPLSAAIATVVIPVVIAYVGNEYTKATKERELQGKFVELSISILRDKPTDGTENLRKWAVQIIDKHSGVPISEAAKDDLVKRVPIVSEIYEPGIKYKEQAEKRSISEIILSDTQTDNIDALVSFLKTPDARGSYHYVIDKNGKIKKLVDENNIAYGASGHNEIAVCIGLIHLQGQQYPPEQLRSLTTLLSEISTRHSIKSNKILLKSDINPQKTNDLKSLIKNIRNEVAAKE